MADRFPRQIHGISWLAEAALPPGHCCLVGQVIGLPLVVPLTLAKLQRTNSCAQVPY